MATFSEALQAEIVALEKELEADPRFLKLRHLRTLQPLYQGGATPEPALDRGAVRLLFPTPSLRATAARSDPVRPAILEASEEVIRELGAGSPVKTAEIFDMLPTDIAKTIKGKIPKSNLSAMLHNSKRFVSHGREGWTLPVQGSQDISANVSGIAEEDLVG